MTAGDRMRLDLDAGLARLTLTGAARGNALDGKFCAELAEVAVEIATRGDVRCLLITADGPAFSYGGDIKGFVGELEALPRTVLGWTATFHSAVARLQRMDAPTVVAVQGVCAGGMVGFAAGCDVLIAAEDAAFHAGYSGIGFSCDCGASTMIARRIGISRAKRFLLLNETLEAADALSAGLADEVVPADQLIVRAEAVARRLAAGPTNALGEMRRLFLTVSEQPLESQLELEAQALVRVVGGADAREGLKAFAAKRAPRFEGR